MEKKDLIPEGKYRAKATGGEFGVAQTGTEYVFVGFEVSTEGPWKGTALSWKGYFTDKTTERTIESLRYCGCVFPDNDITNLSGLGQKEVTLVVEHEEDDKGRWWPKVQWVNSGGPGIKDTQKMGAGEKASFRSRMKAALVATGGPAPKHTNDEPPPIGDEDIPF